MNNIPARPIPQLLGAPLGPDGEKGSVLADRLVRRLSPNARGRDFLAGPIRGRFDALARAMRREDFDETSDRLICVGDLVDPERGPLPVCEFLAAPFVHAARSRRDHEFAQLDPVEIRMIAKLPGGAFAWAAKLSDRQLAAAQDALRTLPLVLEIPTRTGTAGIVHSLPPGHAHWLELVSALESRNEAAVSCVLTESELAHGITVRGVDRVFVGHAPRPAGTRLSGNVVPVDTGTTLRELGLRTRRSFRRGIGRAAIPIRDRFGTAMGRLPQALCRDCGP